MDEKAKLIETLLEKVTDYSKSTYELVKLRILDRSLDVISSLVTRYIVWAMLVLFLIFSSLGGAYWLGEILGKTYYGLFAISAFYGLFVIIFILFLRKAFKKFVISYIIKHEIK